MCTSFKFLSFFHCLGKEPRFYKRLSNFSDSSFSPSWAVLIFWSTSSISSLIIFTWMFVLPLSLITTFSSFCLFYMLHEHCSRSFSYYISKFLILNSSTKCFFNFSRWGIMSFKLISCFGVWIFSSFIAAYGLGETPPIWPLRSVISSRNWLIISVYYETWYSTLSTFLYTLVLIFLALFAYFKVLWVSS